LTSFECNWFKYYDPYTYILYFVGQRGQSHNTLNTELPINVANEQIVNEQTIAAYHKAKDKGSRPSNQFKLVTLGPEGAGKSSTIDTLLNEKFDPYKKSTVGASVNTCNVDRIMTDKWRKSEHTLVQVAQQHYGELKAAMKEISVENHHRYTETDMASGMSVKTYSQDLYKKVKNVLVSREISGNNFRMVVFDLGGQEIYYEIHNLFLALEDVALLVFDSSKELNKEVVSRERVGKFGEKISARGMQSTLEIIEMHLQCVYNRGQEAPQGSISQRNPVVIMVGAHAENVSTQDKKYFIDAIRKHFQGRKLLEHLPFQLEHAFHFIANSNPNAQDIDHLRCTITLAAAPVIKINRPISYLEFEHNIIKHASTKVRLEKMEVVKIAKDVGIQNEDVDSLLKYYMYKGILLYYPEEELLTNEIFISPQEVSDLVCTIITTHHYYPTTADLHQADERYNKHALLEEALFDFILEKTNQQKDKTTILGLLKIFNLAAEVPRNIKFPGELRVPKRGRVFFVPSMLIYDEKDLYKKKEEDIVVVYYFPEKFLPETIFNQLLVKTINWCYAEKNQLSW